MVTYLNPKNVLKENKNISELMLFPMVTYLNPKNVLKENKNISEFLNRQF